MGKICCASAREKCPDLHPVGIPERMSSQKHKQKGGDDASLPRSEMSFDDKKSENKSENIEKLEKLNEIEE